MSDFVLACQYIAEHKNLYISDEMKLQLYGMYKQATMGNNDCESPGFFDFVGKAKWNGTQILFSFD